MLYFKMNKLLLGIVLVLSLSACNEVQESKPSVADEPEITTKAKVLVKLDNSNGADVDKVEIAPSTDTDTRSIVTSGDSGIEFEASTFGSGELTGSMIVIFPPKGKTCTPTVNNEVEPIIVFITCTDTPISDTFSANAGTDQSVVSGDKINLSASNSQGDISTYLWSEVTTSDAVLTDANTDRASFIAPTVTETTFLRFKLVVTDGDKQIDNDTVDITINPLGKTPPKANAGDDQSVFVNTLVTLDASGSSDDGSIVTYLWQEVSDQGVSISDVNSDKTTFTAPAVTDPTILSFKLLVIDDDNLVANDIVEITVNPLSNMPPVADAGDNQTVFEKTLITLDASDSTDGDGSIVTYLWQEVSGQNISLNGANTSKLTFTAPAVSDVTTLTFKVTITDNKQATATDTVDVVVNPTTIVNQAPTIDMASDFSIDENKAVLLTASASDLEGSSLSYLWQQTSGDAISLSGKATTSATFNSPKVTKETDLEFKLTVSDGEKSSTATIVVTVKPVNMAPKAIITADALQAKEQTKMSFHGGTSTDTDGSVASYWWEPAAGCPEGMTINDANTADASIIAPITTEIKEYTLNLTVTDNEGAKATTSITFTVTPVNTAPTVTASNIDYNVNVNNDGGVDYVEFNPVATDEDGTIVSYKWEQIDINNDTYTVALANDDQAKASFNVDGDMNNDEYEVTEDAAMTFQVTVTDNEGATASDTFVVNLKVNNSAPTANAGDDSSVMVGSDDVRLNGSGSDNETKVLSYAWQQIGGVSVTLSDEHSREPTFTVPNVSVDTDLSFKLTVTDKSKASTDDTVIITINPIPTGPLIKLDSNGNRVADAATEWSCVEDTANNLIWEVKTTDGGLRDKDHTYTWYVTDGWQGSSLGIQNGGSCYDNNCDTESYPVEVNKAGICGFKDWRMPSISEIDDLVDTNFPNPTINHTFFPNTHSDYYCSSSTQYQTGSVYPLYQSFSSEVLTVDGTYIRLVRTISN